LATIPVSSELSIARLPNVIPVPNWYALYTRPSHEKRVVEQLGLRQIECYLPAYRSSRRWKNRCKVELELPLFPGYVFARFSRRQHGGVLDVPSVVSIVGNGREAIALPADEVESLRSGLSLRHAEPHPYLNVGERARILRGPLEGFAGIVQRRCNGLRVVLSLPAILKSFAVEIDECDLELLVSSSSEESGALKTQHD
jgi:transcription antitermination factor NusG